MRRLSSCGPTVAGLWSCDIAGIGLSELGVGPWGDNQPLMGKYNSFHEWEKRELPVPGIWVKTISGGRWADLVMQGVSPGLATCDPVQGVPAQGILDSSATCARTTESPDTRRSRSSRQLAAIPIPALHRQRRRAAAFVAEEILHSKWWTIHRAVQSHQRLWQQGWMSASPLPLKQTYLMMVLLTRGLWMRRFCYALLPRKWNLRLVRLRLAQPKPSPVVQPAELNANKIAVRFPHLRSRKKCKRGSPLGGTFKL